MRRLGVIAFACALAGCEVAYPIDALTRGGPAADGGAFEGGSVGLADGAAPTGPFCASQSPKPLFCQDFDEAPLLSEGWTGMTAADGTTALGGTEYVSSPSALVVQSNELPRNATPGVATYQTFPALAGAAAVLTFALDVRVNTYDATGSTDAVLCAFVLKDASGTVWSLQVAATYDTQSGAFSIDFDEDTTPGNGGAEVYVRHAVTSLTLATRTWTRVTIEVTLQAPDGPAATAQNTARLLFGTSEAVNVPLQVLTVNGTPEIIVGYEWIDPPSPPWMSFYDDVTFDSRSL